MCSGQLNLYCLECSEMVEWRKEAWIREDGYYDWHLVVGCECGEIEEEEVRRLAEAAYAAEVGRMIFEAQEAAMLHRLGPALHDAFNGILGGAKT